MDEIVKAVAEKTGMPAEQVRPVVQAVIGELKQRLPAPIAGQIDGLLGSSGTAQMIDQASSLLGGLMGKKD